MKSFYPEILEIACDRLIYVAKHTGARVRGPVFLPIERKLYTVLTSPHVNKSAREQFEKKRRTRLLDVHHPTPATMAALATLEMPLGLTLWVLTPDDAYDLGDSSRRRRLRDARRILGLEEIAEDGVDEHEEDALGGVLDDEAGE